MPEIIERNEKLGATFLVVEVTNDDSPSSQFLVVGATDADIGNGIPFSIASVEDSLDDALASIQTLVDLKDATAEAPKKRAAEAPAKKSTKSAPSKKAADAPAAPARRKKAAARS